MELQYARNLIILLYIIVKSILFKILNFKFKKKKLQIKILLHSNDLIIQ